MRIVVTGATGNVGTALVERLRREPGAEIVGVARRPPGTAEDRVRWEAADVTESDLRPIFIGADAVVHLAWQFQPTHRPAETWEANVAGSRRVFDAVARVRVPALVHASSVGAYSPGPGLRVDESWPTDSLPTAGYGREKAYVERMLDAFEARNPDVRVVRLRPAFIFQRRSASEQRRIFAGPFVPNWIARPGALPVLPLPRGLRFQALTAADVAEAYFLAATSADAQGAYNVAADPVIDGERIAQLLGTRAVTVPARLARLAMATGWWGHLVPAEPALLDLVLSLPELDCTRAHTALGWEPQASSLDALQQLIEGFVRGEGGPTPALAPDSLHERVDEVRTGVGERNTVKTG
jgi:nucleoside-diphosphate-sugar epimerase